MKKVLFITDHYIDKNIGSSKGSRGFIKVFSEIYKDVTFIYPDYEGSDIEQYIPLGVKKIPCIDNRNLVKKGIDYYRGRLHRFCDIVRRHLKKHKYEIIVIDHSHIWSSLTDAFVSSGAKLITIHHNVEKDYVRDNPVSFYLRIPYQYFSIKAEKDAVMNSNVNLTHTGKDKDDLMKMFPNAKGGFYHLGAFDYNMVDYNPSKVADPNTFIITGVLSTRQSTIPIVDFVNHYWPIVIEEKPKAKLIIAGRKPTDLIKKACSSNPSILLVADPEDMTEYLDEAKYYICPINLGSGQKTRISDGLRKGMPVLCHEVSIYGYETIFKAGYINTYHDVQSFRSSLRKVIMTEYDSKEIFREYSNFFSLESSVIRLKKILSEEHLLEVYNK